MFILVVLLSFLFGSIPASFLIAKSHGIDLRLIGSGNTGATNLSRALGKGYGALGYVLDALKGALPVFIAWHQLGFPNWQVSLIGLAAVTGHIFSPFLGFKGGKGVATGSGVFLVLSPVTLIIVLVIWLVTYLKTGYVSLGSLLGSIALAVAYLTKNNPFGTENWPLTSFALLITIVVVYTHRSNIGRLWRGEEKKA